ncbi:MAG: B-box zinc finger protein [Pseudomonadales bacterium]|nr:B-box zinc finger protein [Pseudomonadales bacterium]
MKCEHHPGAPAVGDCQNCGIPICGICATPPVKALYASAARVWHQLMNTLSKEAMRAINAKWVILSMMVSTVPQIPPRKSPSARQRVPPKGIFSLR